MPPPSRESCSMHCRLSLAKAGATSMCSILPSAVLKGQRSRPGAVKTMQRWCVRPGLLWWGARWNYPIERARNGTQHVDGDMRVACCRLAPTEVMRIHSLCRRQSKPLC